MRTSSIEQPLWRALTAYRVLALAYALARFVYAYQQFAHPLGAWFYMGVLTAWTLLTLPYVSSAARCSRPFLAADLTVALAGILLTMVLDSHARIVAGQTTLPSIWAAGSVLAFAIKGGWRWGALAWLIVAVSNIVERGRVSEGNVHSIVLLFFVSTGIGYVVEVARGSERALARALQIEAATRERERLARDIHDGVLQVLAMVQRRGAEIGGPAAELGRLAGEQEAALRALVSGAPVPGAREAAREAVQGTAGQAAGASAAGGTAGRSPGNTDPAGSRAARTPDAAQAGPGTATPADLRAALSPYAGVAVTVAAPGEPVLLEPHAVREVAAAVGAALDNVRRHAGPSARAWILVEEEPKEVLVTVRDDGPGIPEGRLTQAEREGRLGVAQSIRGRLADLGGSAVLLSVPGQGTEVELRLPRRQSARRP